MKPTNFFVLISFAAVLPLSQTMAADTPRANNKLTAEDQSNEKGDVELTRTIRQSIVKEKDLSTAAHNVKIIVANNAVTLRGPVKTAQEADVIVSKAKTAAPKGMKVVNELEVETR